MTITKNSNDYVEKYMKIKFHSDEELPRYWKRMSLYENFFRWNYKFIGYLHNHDKVKPLNIMPPKTSAYVSYDEQIKWMCFFYWRWPII